MKMLSLLADTNECTGCAACLAVCGTGALRMEADREGFLRPVADHKKCVGCGRCNKVCPAITSNIPSRFECKESVFACWTNDKNLRKQSSSGGVFSVLASEIIRRGGVVCGAAVVNKEIRHIAVDNVDALAKLRGSKYVQSDTRGIFKDVATALSAGRSVLFVGTPCQVAGLYGCLGKEPKELYTCDLVCHGTPSPKIWAEYVSMLEKRYGAPVSKVSFRSKRIGWRCFGMEVDFTNGKTYHRDMFRDPFIRGFLREIFLRPSCHRCIYTNLNRPADITLSDYWSFEGYERQSRDNDKGISMVMINSEKGVILFSAVKGSMACFTREISDIVRKSRALREPFPPSEKRAAFWRDYEGKGFDYVVDKYLYPDKDAWLKRFKMSQFVRLLIKIRDRITKPIVQNKRQTTAKM